MSKKLLLADDSITIQKVVGITFAGAEYELTAVGDGDSALEKARAERPDIILADVCMPGKSGYELCAAVKGDPSLSDVPVLLLTGTFEPFDESKATESGADGWVAKPFESQTLIGKVEDLLARCAEAAPLVSSSPQDEEPAVPERTVSDIWSDLARIDMSAEPEASAPGAVFLPDAFDVEPEQAASPLSGDDDLWPPLDAEPAADDDLVPLNDPLDLEPEHDPLGDVFDEEDPFDREGAEISPDEADDDPWAYAGEEVDDEEEIVLLSESDIVEEDGEAAEEPAVPEDAPAVAAFFEEGLQEDSSAAASSGAAEEALAEDPWYQAESTSEMGDDPQESFAGDEEDDLLDEELAELAVDPFDDAAPDDDDEAFDDQRFASEPAEAPPAAFESVRSSGDDPFQIGAADFLSPPPGADDAAAESLWDAAEESLEDELPESAPVQGEEAVAPAPTRPVSEGEGVVALSEEEIARIVEKVASEVVGRLAQTVLERIAWEVVPDLAEVMIKEEIRKIREEVQ